MKQNSKTRWAVAGGAVVVAAGAMAALYLATPRETPQGQPPLLALGAGNLEQLRSAFNASSDRPRVIAFLSPT